MGHPKLKTQNPNRNPSSKVAPLGWGILPIARSKFNCRNFFCRRGMSESYDVNRRGRRERCAVRGARGA